MTINAMRAPRLDVTIEHTDQLTVITVCGEVDLATASVLSGAVEQALSADPRAVIIDLSDVTFLASVGLSVLISLRRRAGSNVAVLAVADGPFTRRPMELTGLTQTIPVHTDVASALESLTGPQPGAAQALRHQQAPQSSQ